MREGNTGSDAEGPGAEDGGLPEEGELAEDLERSLLEDVVGMQPEAERGVEPSAHDGFEPRPVLLEHPAESGPVEQRRSGFGHGRSANWGGRRALPGSVTGALGWDPDQRIDAAGGMIAAIDSGYIRREIADAAFAYQCELDARRKLIVGVNAFEEAEEKPIDLLEIDESVARDQRFPV